MLAPYQDRVYDPCCGSGGMFVQSLRFVQAHATGNGNGGQARADVSIFGQESNHTTWRLAKMNLAIRGIDGNLGPEHADSFHRELTGYDDDGNLTPGSDIDRIASTYHAWRGDSPPSPTGRGGGGEGYVDIPGFCKAATLDDIRQHNHILTPGRYVGAAEVEDDGEPFEEKMERLMAQLEEQFTESARLETTIWENLGWLWGTEGG